MWAKIASTHRDKQVLKWMASGNFITSIAAGAYRALGANLQSLPILAKQLKWLNAEQIIVVALSGLQMLRQDPFKGRSQSKAA